MVEEGKVRLGKAAQAWEVHSQSLLPLIPLHSVVGVLGMGTE